MNVLFTPILNVVDDSANLGFHATFVTMPFGQIFFASATDIESGYC